MRTARVGYANSETVTFFRMNAYFFDCERLFKLRDNLPMDEKEVFDVDIRNVNWPLMAKIFQYGIGKYYLNLDMQSPLEPVQ